MRVEILKDRKRSEHRATFRDLVNAKHDVGLNFPKHATASGSGRVVLSTYCVRYTLSTRADTTHRYLQGHSSANGQVKISWAADAACCEAETAQLLLQLSKKGFADNSFHR